jgi:hypothetical protein
MRGIDGCNGDGVAGKTEGWNAVQVMDVPLPSANLARGRDGDTSIRRVELDDRGR